MTRKQQPGKSVGNSANFRKDAAFVDWELNDDERAQFVVWATEFGESVFEQMEEAFGPDMERVSIAWQDGGSCWAVWVFQRLLLHEVDRYVLAVRGKTIRSAILHAAYKHSLCGGDYKSKAKGSSKEFVP